MARGCYLTGIDLVAQVKYFTQDAMRFTLSSSSLDKSSAVCNRLHHRRTSTLFLIENLLGAR